MKKKRNVKKTMEMEKLAGCNEDGERMLVTLSGKGLKGGSKKRRKEGRNEIKEEGRKVEK